MWSMFNPPAIIAQLNTLDLFAWGLPVVDCGQQTKGETDTESHGHSILGVRGHTLEDLPCTNDSRHNGGQTRLSQYNVSSSTGSISCTCNKLDLISRCPATLSNSRFVT